mgnify:CR=1 FL=1
MGLLVGVVGAFVQAERLVLERLASAPAIPWGAVLMVLALVVIVRGATWAMGTRWGGWLALAGWITASILLGGDSPSGDLAMVGPSENIRPIAYLLAGVVIGSAAATLPLPAPRPSEHPVQAPAASPDDDRTDAVPG